MITTAQTGSFVTFEITPSIVQSWFETPSQNFGLVIKGTIEDSATANAVAFHPKESTNPVFRPKLTIYYTVKELI